MSEEKGLRYNEGKRKWGMIHFRSLEPMIEVLEYGAHKYSIYENNKGEEIKGVDIPIEEAYKYKIKSSGINNWKLGLDDREILESMQRHLAALLDGELRDKESKILHMGHIMCNAMFWNYFYENKFGNTK